MIGYVQLYTGYSLGEEATRLPGRQVPSGSDHWWPSGSAGLGGWGPKKDRSGMAMRYPGDLQRHKPDGGGSRWLYGPQARPPVQYFGIGWVDTTAMPAHGFIS